jgi:ferrous iron transport protein A
VNEANDEIPRSIATPPISNPQKKTMNGKVNGKNDGSPDAPAKRWRFAFWGGSDSPEKNEVPEEGRDGSYPLSLAAGGKQVWLAGFKGKGGMNRLLGMGLAPGTSLMVIGSGAGGSVLVGIGDSRIGLGAEIADNILVSDRPLEGTPERSGGGSRIYLRELSPGAVGRVVGFDKVRDGYKGKLLSMGLTPGARFTVIRVAPLGDPIEIRVRGFHLSLRKQEADALVVEEVDRA